MTDRELFGISEQLETHDKRTETHACDLISRQAAIDAIRASTSKYTGFMEMEMYTDDDAVEAIEALPSAELEIIRCKNCRNNHWCNIQEAAMAGDNFFCGAAERRIDG